MELMANFFECMAALQDKLAHPMHVVVVGDMYQLPPVPTVSAQCGVQVERNQLHDVDETESLRFQSVTMQFLTLNRFQLTETHTRNLNLMRGRDPFVHTAMWNDYRMLTGGF